MKQSMIDGTELLNVGKTNVSKPTEMESAPSLVGSATFGLTDVFCGGVFKWSVNVPLATRFFELSDVGRSGGVCVLNTVAPERSFISRL